MSVSLNQSSDFRSTWYEHYAIGGHPTFVLL